MFYRHIMCVTNDGSVSRTYCKKRRTCCVSIFLIVVTEKLKKLSWFKIKKKLSFMRVI
jgi:hypothetical protein